MMLLIQLRALMADCSFPWALCGGYAAELFAGRVIRPHGDVDLALPECARADAIAFFLARGWQIHEYRGMGKVKPIHDPRGSEPGRSLMASRGDAPPVQFFPCDEEGLLYHLFTPGMTELNFVDLLFSGDVGPVLQTASGIPILAPETLLLHKSAQAAEAAAQMDYHAVYPLMDEGQRARLRAALQARWPDGHPWID